MSALLARLAGLALVAAGAVCGGCAGLVVGYFVRLPGQPPWLTVAEYPLPHHVPRYEGGISLRFAMVHDALHERYPRHGPAYYRERNRLVRQELARRDGAGDDAHLALFDDLGAGLDALGHHDEAVDVLRDKLRRQRELGHTGRRLYTTYANLGTFLVHGSARAALSGDAAARARVREGLSFLHQSIDVNPQAHFGREVWQAVAVEYLLAVSDDPGLLSRYDMVGDLLEAEVEPAKERCYRPMYAELGVNRDVAAYLREDPAEPRLRDTALRLREYVLRVGAEDGWKQAVPCSHTEPVPFDEPVLGIVGMWRLGGGANPHFALALGEILLRVGQRYIAWCAYERAADMADRVGPAPDVRRRFVEHCRRRQQTIEQGLTPRDVEELRPRFRAELEHGRRYQREYQQYEADRLRAGAALDDPHFYDDFDAAHGPIASPVGEEEKFVAETRDALPFFNWPAAVFAAGLSASVAACLVRLAGRLRQARRGAG